jgi:hypothetical protein
VLQAGRSPVRVPDEVDFFLNISSSSSRTKVLGSTQPLTEMSTSKLHGGKKRQAHRADNLAAICDRMSYNRSRNPKALHGLHRDNLLLRFFYLHIFSYSTI